MYNISAGIAFFVYGVIKFNFTAMQERINRIKEVLVINGMSQKILAAKLGKNPNTVTSMCNNKSQPHLKDLKRIAEIFDVDIRELLVSTKNRESI